MTKRLPRNIGDERFAHPSKRLLAVGTRAPQRLYDVFSLRFLALSNAQEVSRQSNTAAVRFTAHGLTVSRSQPFVGCSDKRIKGFRDAQRR